METLPPWVPGFVKQPCAARTVSSANLTPAVFSVTLGPAVSKRRRIPRSRRRMVRCGSSHYEVLHPWQPKADPKVAFLHRKLRFADFTPRACRPTAGCGGDRKKRKPRSRQMSASHGARCGPAPPPSGLPASAARAEWGLSGRNKGLLISARSAGSATTNLKPRLGRRGEKLQGTGGVQPQRFRHARVGEVSGKH